MNFPRITYLSILAGATSWCAAIVIAPVLVTHAGLSATLGAMIFEFFRPVCHQIGARSLHLYGEPLAVCARCSAIYIAFLAGTITYPFIHPLDRPAYPPRSVLLAALVPMLFDVACGIIGLYDNNNLTRVVSGAIFGFVAAWFIIPGAIEAAGQIFSPSTPSSSLITAKGNPDA